MSLELHDGVRITQAHFHCGEEGANGPVIVIFLAGFHDRGWDIDGHWLDDVTITDEQHRRHDLRLDPARHRPGDGGRPHLRQRPLASPTRRARTRGQVHSDDDDDDDHDD